MDDGSSALRQGDSSGLRFDPLPTQRFSPLLRGGFRGGGGGGRPPPQGFDPLPTQRVPPLILFQKSVFGRPTLKLFQRRLRRQYILTLRGSARQKKRDFFVKFFQNVPKNGFFDCFFKNLPAAQKI